MMMRRLGFGFLGIAVAVAMTVLPVFADEGHGKKG